MADEGGTGGAGLVGAGLEGGAIRTEESSLAVSAVTVERPKQLRSAPPPQHQSKPVWGGGGGRLGPWMVYSCLEKQQ